MKHSECLHLLLLHKGSLVDTVPQGCSAHPCLSKVPCLKHGSHCRKSTETLTGLGADTEGMCPTKILELALLSIIQLSALDDDGVCRQIDSPGQRGSRAEHLQATQRIPSPTPQEAHALLHGQNVMLG